MKIDLNQTMHTNAQPDVNIIEISDLETLPYKNACITIGNFDGVHLGHQAIINQMVRTASQQARPVLVLTFYPNPTVFFRAQQTPYYLSTPHEKEQQMLALGVDEVITFRFNRDFANLTAEAFLLQLRDKLGLGVLVVGQDFALGKDRAGTIPVLKALGQSHGFEVKTIPQVELAEEGVSSTRIRQMLDAGAVDRAARLLGRLYSVSGDVTHGSDRGSRIGLPTANMDFWPLKKLPAVGVYATRVQLAGQVLKGITNIGYRPTFEAQTEVNIETHILDFDQNIYGQSIALEFVVKLRDEHKFSGVDAFLAQIELDKAKARRIFEDDQT